ncbi:arylamine N-acetyltransferase 1-like [Astyanax mexicanus]|nr:arylamine N-acetyltransferase 1-like [Astyanax mexicanus]
MDVDRYLARIGCPSPCSPTLETLRCLHLNHLLAVPFENLSVHSGEPLSLDLPLLYQKIVVNRRGGFCYELNGLFWWLLCQLGFEVHILSAQVKNRFTGAYGPPFDHFISMVTLEGHRWLCDVGFGSGFQLPLSLETDGPQKQTHGLYRLRTEAQLMYVEMSEIDAIKNPKEDTAWRALYKFTFEPRQREDFNAMCHYHQTSIHSVFVCKSLCSLLLPNGRITIIGRKLIINSLSDKKDQPSQTKTDLSDQEITELLKDKFGIVLSNPLTPKDTDIVPPPVNY